MQNRDLNKGSVGNQGNLDRVTQSPTSQRVEGNWNQFKGKLREKWGDLTDDELDRLQGQRDQIVGRLQEHTGRQRQEVERDIDTISRESGYRFQ